MVCVCAQCLCVGVAHVNVASNPVLSPPLSQASTERSPFFVVVVAGPTVSAKKKGSQFLAAVVWRLLTKKGNNWALLVYVCECLASNVT